VPSPGMCRFVTSHQSGGSSGWAGRLTLRLPGFTFGERRV